jgi:hypothetical protein
MTTLVLATLSIPAAQASAPRVVTSPPAVGDVSVSVTPEARGAEPSRYLQAVTLRLRSGVQNRRSATWRHQDYLGQTRTKTAYRERETRSRPYLRWIKRTWAGRAHRAWKVRVHTLRDFEVAAGSNAWLRAVDEAQRPYPNTASWLISCSASEGGHGRWVPNSQGSGANGWLQFMEGTFWRMFWAAKADVESRGYRVPASAASWYSPLGQALAGAWGLTNGRRHEWAGHGC